MSVCIRTHLVDGFSVDLDRAKGGNEVLAFADAVVQECRRGASKDLLFPIAAGV